MDNVVQLRRPVASVVGLKTFAAEEIAVGLTGAALKTVVRLVHASDGGNAEGAALLGVSTSTWDRIMGDGTAYRARTSSPACRR